MSMILSQMSVVVVYIFETCVINGKSTIGIINSGKLDIICTVIEQILIKDLGYFTLNFIYILSFGRKGGGGSGWLEPNMHSY